MIKINQKVPKLIYNQIMKKNLFVLAFVLALVGGYVSIPEASAARPPFKPCAAECDPKPVRRERPVERPILRPIWN